MTSKKFYPINFFISGNYSVKDDFVTLRWVLPKHLNSIFYIMHNLYTGYFILLSERNFFAWQFFLVFSVSFKNISLCDVYPFHPYLTGLVNVYLKRVSDHTLWCVYCSKVSINVIFDSFFLFDGVVRIFQTHYLSDKILHQGL